MFLQNDLYYVAVGMKVQDERTAEKWKKVHNNEGISRLLFEKIMALVDDAVSKPEPMRMEKPSITEASSKTSSLANMPNGQPSHDTYKTLSIVELPREASEHQSPPQPPTTHVDIKCSVQPNSQPDEIVMQQIAKSSRRKSQRHHPKTVQVENGFKDSAEEFRSIFFSRLKSCAVSSVPAEMKAKEEMRSFLNMICDGSGVKSLISMKKFQKFIQTPTNSDSEKSAKMILMDSIKKVIDDRTFWQDKLKTMKDTRLTMAKIARYLKSAEERVSAINLSRPSDGNEKRSGGKSSKSNKKK